MSESSKPQIKLDLSELEEKVGAKVAEMLSQFAKEMEKRVGKMAWQICNDYAEYATWEPLNNWRSSIRTELVEERLWDKDDYWGKKMRRAILAEHRDELMPLLATEYTKQLEEEVVKMKDLYEFECRCNRSRPSY
jgi:hypothetical protein